MDIGNLSKNPLFKGLTENEIRDCVAALSATEKSFQKDHAILHAGNKTSVMGIVLSGSVTIESNDMWGNRTVLGLVQKNGIFAETFALLYENVMLVDVVANTDCDILFLNLKKLQANDTSSGWRFKVISNLLTICARKNLHLSGRSLHISHKTIRERVLSYLNSLSLREQTNELVIPFDRRQLADYLNVERTALSKELSKMQRDGLIEYEKNSFVLK